MSGIVVAAGACLAATVVLATASMTWASDQGGAFEEAVRASLYLGLFVLAACTASAKGRSQWLSGLTVGLGAISIVALVAYLQPGLLGSEPFDVPNAAGRLSYPIGYWNGAAALLALAAVLFAYGESGAPTRLLRASATAFIPLVLLGIWLANSRGAGVTLLIGWAVLVATSADRMRTLRGIVLGLAGGLPLVLVTKQMHALTSGTVDSASRADGDWLSAICIVVVGVVLLIAWFADDWVPRPRISRPTGLAIGGIALLGVIAGLIAANPVHRFNEFKTAPDTNTGVSAAAADLSSNGRWQFWVAALDAFEAHPLDGVGAGGYEHWWALHPKAELFVRNPHSLPLQQGAELGVPGLLLFGGFVAAVIIGARRRLAAGLGGDVGVLMAIVATAALGAAVDWTWQIPAVFGPAVVCAGLLVASAPSARAARSGPWLGFGVLAAAWIAIVGSAIVLLTEIELSRSRDAAGDGQVAEAIDRARTARSIQPWSAEPYTQLALLEGQRRDYPAALAYLRQAQERDSEDWRLYVIEARLQRQSGNPAAGFAATVHAELFSPFSLVSLGEAQRATDEARR